MNEINNFASVNFGLRPSGYSLVPKQKCLDFPQCLQILHPSPLLNHSNALETNQSNYYSMHYQGTYWYKILLPWLICAQNVQK